MFRTLAVAFVLLLLVVACGGDAPDAQGRGAEEQSGDPEQPSITVATIPIQAMAPFFHAMDEGAFEDQGLKVTHAVGSGGAELIPRLLSGEIDIFWTALEPFMVARSEGIELDLVAAGHFYEVIDGSDIGLFTLPDSGLETIADLEGATIAINTINTFGHIYSLAAAQHQGLDTDSIRWVEIPFPQMAPALERGEVDAAWTPEPFATVMRDNLGAVPLLDPDADEEIMADLPAFREVPGGAWGATSQFAAENPNTVAAFARAIMRANMEVENDHDLGVEIIQANTDIEEDVLERSIWPSWFEDHHITEHVQIRADLMHEFGMLEEEVDVTDYLHATIR